jgi:hypothetical protein
MCGPAAIVPLTIASAVVGAAGQVYQGLSAGAQSRYEGAIADQNRAMEITARNEAIDRGNVEARNHWRRVAQAYGDQLSRQAGSGLDVTFGSPAALLGDVMQIGGEDSQTIRGNTNREVRGYEINAANYTMQGRAARARGRAQVIGGLMEGATTILSMATQTSKMTPSFGRSG